MSNKIKNILVTGAAGFLGSHLSEKLAEMGYKVIGIDEVQFLDDSIVDVCKSLASQNKRIIAAGLDTDYLGQPFGPMPKIMCEADYLDKLRAICVLCGNPASYTQRTSSDADQVVLGELDKYEARCRNCFKLPKDN